MCVLVASQHHQQANVLNSSRSTQHDKEPRYVTGCGRSITTHVNHAEDGLHSSHSCSLRARRRFFRVYSTSQTVFSHLSLGQGTSHCNSHTNRMAVCRVRCQLITANCITVISGLISYSYLTLLSTETQLRTPPCLSYDVPIHSFLYTIPRSSSEQTTSGTHSSLACLTKHESNLEKQRTHNHLRRSLSSQRSKANRQLKRASHLIRGLNGTDGCACCRHDTGDVVEMTATGRN